MCFITLPKYEWSLTARMSNIKTVQIAYNIVMSWGWVGNTWPMAGDELVRYWHSYSCWRAGDELVYPGVSWGWACMGDELVGGWVDCHHRLILYAMYVPLCHLLAPAIVLVIILTGLHVFIYVIPIMAGLKPFSSQTFFCSCKNTCNRPCPVQMSRTLFSRQQTPSLVPILCIGLYNTRDKACKHTDRMWMGF